MTAGAVVDFRGDGSSKRGKCTPPRSRGTSARSPLADEQRRVVARAVARLSPRRQHVVRRYYGLAHEPESVSAIGADLDMSATRAGAIRDAALRDLALELEHALAEGGREH